VIYDVLRAAAANGEEELRQLWAAEEKQRLTGARFWIEILRAMGASLQPGTDARTAVDTLGCLWPPTTTTDWSCNETGPDTSTSAGWPRATSIRFGWPRT
jgi:hypothetical protein